MHHDSSTDMLTLAPRALRGIRQRAVPLALALTLAAGFGACAPIAVVGAAIVVNEEFTDNAQEVVLKQDVSYVWASVKSSMTHMTSDLLEVDEDLKAVRTYVDGAQVTVHVQRYDVGETRIRTAARKLLVYNDEVARMVQERLITDLR